MIRVIASRGVRSRGHADDKLDDPYGGGSAAKDIRLREYPTCDRFYETSAKDIVAEGRPETNAHSDRRPPRQRGKALSRGHVGGVDARQLHVVPPGFNTHQHVRSANALHDARAKSERCQFATG
jgi:hypothetical protein